MSIAKFPLPDVGEGLTEAEIVSWRVSPGDKVAVNQESGVEGKGVDLGGWPNIKKKKKCNTSPTYSPT